MNIESKSDENLQQSNVIVAVCDVSGIDNNFMDWNKLSLNQMVEYLRKKYMFSSSGEAKYIYHLIEFYDNHK